MLKWEASMSETNQQPPVIQVLVLTCYREDTNDERMRGELEHLTLREREVLGLLSNGHRNAQIAEELGLSVRTVEFHVSNLLDKLGARSRAEAISRTLHHP
jgi:DNA-binding NarL/FixJ family response regulator